MDKIIVDANVITKWFIEEENSSKAEILRERFVEGKLELLCPPILFFEVLNALKYSKLFDKLELDFAGESLEKYGFSKKKDGRTQS